MIKDFLIWLFFTALTVSSSFYLGYMYADLVHRCPPTKAEFYGSTFLDADHIERTWIYRDTVEYSRPKINFKL